MAFHSLRDHREEEERRVEQEKERHLMALIIAHKPEDALALVQGKRPQSLPPSAEDEEGPADEATFLFGDPYFHIVPPAP